MTLFSVILTRFDGDEAVARRYCRDQARQYRHLAYVYPNLRQLAEGYERAARSVNGVPKVRGKKSPKSPKRSA